MRTCLSFSSSKVSNGETESVKTMIVHDEAESDTAITPSKDGTLIVRQVLEDPFLALFIVLCFAFHHSSIPSVCTFNAFYILFHFLTLYSEKRRTRSFETLYKQIPIHFLLAPLLPSFFLFFFPPLQLSIESAVPVFDSRA